MKVNGHRIKELRELHGLTRIDLAQAADLGERRVMQVEAVESVNLNRNVVHAMAKLLKVKPEALL